MRTDADHPACVRDPAIELLLSHTATLADEWCSRRRARRQLGLRIGEIRPAAKWFHPIGRQFAALCVSDVDQPISYNQRATVRTSAKRKATFTIHPRHAHRASPTPRLRRLVDRHHRLPTSGPTRKPDPAEPE